LVLCASRAHAIDLRRPGLNWVRLAGAKTCLSGAELARRVEARLGRVLFVSPGEAEVFVDGVVGPGAQQGWDVTLEVSDPEGHVLGRRDMHFEETDCSAIDEGVALVIALTLYPNTGLTEGGVPLDAHVGGRLDSLFADEPVDPDPAALPPAVTPPPPDASSGPTPPAPAPTPRPRWEVAIDVAPTIGFGQLPEVGMGLTAHVQITPPGVWPIELGAAAFLDQSVQASGGVKGDASFGLVLGSITVCPWQPAGLPALSVCGGAEIGRLRVTPTGFAQLEAPSHDLVVNLLAEAALRARMVGPLYARAAFLLSLPLVQRGYAYQTLEGTSQQLYRMPPLAGRVEIGIGVRF
jgi:hypothetical protein